MSGYESLRESEGWPGVLLVQELESATEKCGDISIAKETTIVCDNDVVENSFNHFHCFVPSIFVSRFCVGIVRESEVRKTRRQWKRLMMCDPARCLMAFNCSVMYDQCRPHHGEFKHHPDGNKTRGSCVHVKLESAEIHKYLWHYKPVEKLGNSMWTWESGTDERKVLSPGAPGESGKC